MRSRYLVDGASVVAVALFLGWVLSLATTRVKNWFVMTDELYYERLAVSVAQTGSLLPRLHGELVSNVNQLYPVLISPLFGDGNVPASLAGAHRLNAFLITSAAIPVYLLARRIGLGRFVSLWAGALSVAVPWVALASFLLTEVVAYPAFCWALLALTHAVARKTWQTDLLALAAIGVAVLARTQFIVLLGVLVVAVVAEAMLDATPRGAPANLWRTRRPFVVLFGALLLVVLGAIAIGKGSQLLGSYSVTAENVRIDFGLFQLAFEHVALLALGLAILPFIVGVGWLVDRVRPSTPEGERAFAVVGCTSLVLVTLQVASFNQRFGAGLVKDRYLFYVVPDRAGRARGRGGVAAVAPLVGARRPDGRGGRRVRVGAARAVREVQRRLARRDPQQQAGGAGDLDALGARPARARGARRCAGAPAREAVPALARGGDLGGRPRDGRASARDRLRVRPPLRRQRHERAPDHARPGRRLQLGRPQRRPDRARDGDEVPGRRARLVGGPGLLVGRRVLERERRRHDGRHVAEEDAALARRTSIPGRAPRSTRPRRSSHSSTRPTCASGLPARSASTTATPTSSRPERPWRGDMAHGRDLPRRLDEAAPAGDDHGLRRAGPEAPLQRFLTITVASPDPLEQRPVTISSNLGRLERHDPAGARRCDQRRAGLRPARRHGRR